MKIVFSSNPRALSIECHRSFIVRVLYRSLLFMTCLIEDSLWIKAEDTYSFGEI